MKTVNLLKTFRFAVLVWTAGFFGQETNAQETSDVTKNTQEPSYFFYQQSEYPRDCKEIHETCSSSNSSGVYYIKPEGYPEPFEAHCDNTLQDSTGWTVILRRNKDGMIKFNRDWDSYKRGFGFPSQEFWIGNERLSYLTNQKKYQLAIEITLVDTSKVDVVYNNFRIGDEFSNYTLISVGQYSGTTDHISWCPRNMVFDNCNCGRRTCRDPTTCQNTCVAGQQESCICPDGFHMYGHNCIPRHRCGCYIPEELMVVAEGETYINTGCNRIVECFNGQITRNETYRCSPNAVCEERDEGRKCYCNEGYSGDGVNCTQDIRTDCMDIFNTSSQDNGVYTIKPTDWPGSPFNVYCNMTDGGGWTVFQRRIDGDVDFYRNWTSYKQGFGNVNDEHWLGNEKLYHLTNQRNYQIRIDFVNRNGAPYYAKFNAFRINNEADNYRLSTVGSYSGTAGAGYMITRYRNKQFTTKDRDNDISGSYNCARFQHGAWWYSGCSGSLNGDYHASRSSDSSIRWSNLPGDSYNIKFTEMKMRPL